MRLQAHASRHPVHSLLLARSLTTVIRPAPPAGIVSRHARTFPSPPCSARALSLSSVFSRKPTPTPPPAVVANVAALEADANANPTDVYKQVALLQALIATKVRPGYDVVIARWERACEFVRSFLSAGILRLIAL